MQTSKMLAMMLCILFIAGCDMMVMPWHKSDLKQMANRPLTCTAGTDCDEKWARTLKWVTSNSKLAVETKSDTLIKTTVSPFASTDSGFIITKVPDGANAYTIHVEASCANIFGCIPPVLELKADFVHFMSPPPADPAAKAK